MILYVTSSCNFRCRTCFFHKSVNQGNDLSLEEFIKISQNSGKISILLIAGGEPFLRPDLVEVCSMFIERNKVDTLYIPTNGFLTDKILVATESLLKKFPQISVSVNPSVDGTKDYHEKTRDIEGSFDQVIRTIRGLSLLKKKYANFQIIVNSVIHRENFEDLKKLAVYLRGFNIDYQAFEIMRGDQRDKALLPADLETVKKIHDFVLANRRWYLDNRPPAGGIAGWLNRATVLGQLGYTQSLKERVLGGKKWPFLCAAGRTIATVFPNGDVGQCELLGTVGNIKNYNHDLRLVLDDSKARQQRDFIKKNRCSCTHICFINASLASDWKSVFKLPYHYIKTIIYKHAV